MNCQPKCGNGCSHYAGRPDTTKPWASADALARYTKHHEKDEERKMDPKLFNQISELLMRQIYTPGISEAMRQSARDARSDLIRLFGTNNNPARLQNMH